MEIHIHLIILLRFVLSTTPVVIKKQGKLLYQWQRKPTKIRSFKYATFMSAIR